MSSKHTKVMKKLEKAGWRREQGRNRHNKFYCPCGEHIVVTGETPSDGRAWMNFASDIRKTQCRYVPSL